MWAKLMEEISARVRMKWLDQVTEDKRSTYLGRQYRLFPQGFLLRMAPAYYQSVMKAVGFVEARGTVRHERRESAVQGRALAGFSASGLPPSSGQVDVEWIGQAQ